MEQELELLDPRHHFLQEKTMHFVVLFDERPLKATARYAGVNQDDFVAGLEGQVFKGRAVEEKTLVSFVSLS